VCVCERERERECVCLCVYVCVVQAVGVVACLCQHVPRRCLRGPLR
jgi:hypothetical protein